MMLALVAAPAGAEEARRSLSVTATVTRSCSVTANEGRPNIACTAGTPWISSTSAVPSRPRRDISGRDAISYFTISY